MARISTRQSRAINDVMLSVRGPDGNGPAYPGFVPALDDFALKAMGARYVALLIAT